MSGISTLPKEHHENTHEKQKHDHGLVEFCSSVRVNAVVTLIPSDVERPH